MAASARILADSISPHGVRLTTLEVVFARCVLAEFNTHRMLSRNSASSRAIPFEKMIKRVLEDPYIPAWTKNQKGMSGEFLDSDSMEYKDATELWLALRDQAIESVQRIGDIGVHKQDVNRALEPWMWHTVIVTATEWSNFDHLRDHPKAHPAIQMAARSMIEARAASTPRKLAYGEWHLPLLDDEERLLEYGCDAVVPGVTNVPPHAKISTGRSARVSYLTHAGVRDPGEDINLHNTLLGNGHMSPLEHAARPATREDQKLAHIFVRDITLHPEDRFLGDLALDPDQLWFGNFRGWVQYRKMISNEHDMLAPR